MIGEYISPADSIGNEYLFGRIHVIDLVFVASLKLMMYMVAYLGFWIADNDWDVELCLIDSMIINEPMVYYI
jgi:hypothetical protein